jgi:hypothetical protein
MDTATLAILITSIAGLIKMFWDSAEADKRALREREWAMADRKEVALGLAAMVDTKAAEVAEHLAVKVDATAAQLATVTQQTSSDIQQAIAENTALTNTIGEKADAATQAAQAAHDKIFSLVGEVKP